MSYQGKWLKGDAILEICRCPIHADFWAVHIGNYEEGGTRLTNSKCCGQWRTIRAWRPSRAEWRDIVRLASNAGRRALGRQRTAERKSARPSAPESGG